MTDTFKKDTINGLKCISGQNRIVRRSRKAMKKMADMENVIAALHCRTYDDDFPCWKCAYYKQDEKPVARCDYRGLMDDAIILLKEQEAVEPKKVKGYNPPMYTIYEYECEKCKSPMMSKQPFCMGCGKAVKWDEL